LYTDRGGHFWLTPKEGEIVDRQRLTQVGRAMRDLGIEMIPAYSPQARGRSERNFGTWQGRLPQELRLRGITTLEEANRFLRDSYIAELNRKFSVPAAQPESAFVPASGKDLDRIFSVQQERVVNQDNTVRVANRTLQIREQNGAARWPKVTCWYANTWMAPGAYSTDRTWWAATPRTARAIGVPNRLSRGEKIPHPPRDFLSPPPSHRRKE
jgi:hypothetical protein